jgi:PAS domain-containing protein
MDVRGIMRVLLGVLGMGPIGWWATASALLGLAGLLWKAAKKVLEGYRWFQAWAKRIEMNHLAVVAMQVQVAEIQAVVGKNGGSTLFGRMDAMEDSIFKLGSVVNAQKIPTILFGPQGQVDEVNVAFRRLTGWSEEDLERGGWRSKLVGPDLVAWDDAVAHEGVFERTLSLRGLAIRIVAEVRPIAGKRFVGWRGEFEAERP